MIPLSDDNRSVRVLPWATYALVAINLVVWVVMWASPAADQQQFYDRFAATPADVVHGGPSAWVTLFTCMFLHASWAHVLGNMLYLWIFGDNIEAAMGHLRYLTFYVVCGVVASAVQVLVDPASTLPLVGASGAIAGVLAAYIVLFPRGMVRTLIVIIPPFFAIRLLPAWLLIGFWIVTQFFAGITSVGGSDQGGTAYFAHIGGFAAGLLLARLFVRLGGVEGRLQTLRRGPGRAPRPDDPPGW
ncbi:MAG: rhomboid family intramembrane serine protease [Cellulomonadaceae bacterium]